MRERRAGDEVREVIWQRTHHVGPSSSLLVKTLTYFKRIQARVVRIEEKKVGLFWISSGGRSIVYEGLYTRCEREKLRMTPGFCPEQL